MSNYGGPAKQWLYFFTALLCFSLNPVSTAAAENGWRLDQEDRIGGTRTVYLTAQGMRIESKHDRVTFVASAPDWKVSMFSDQKQCFYQWPTGKFVNIMSKPIAVFYGVNLAAIPLKKKGPVTKCGIASTAYETPYKLLSAVFWGLADSAKTAHRMPCTANAIFTDSLKGAASEADILVRLYGLPEAHGIPLMFEYHDQDNDFHWHLRTFAVKEVNVAPALLALPAGYKRVCDPQDVLRGADNEDVLKNLF